MLGLNAIANCFAHSPAAVMLASSGMQESLLDAAAESLMAAKAMERRTASAVLVNLALGSGQALEEAAYVQALCALFNALGEETDVEARAEASMTLALIPTLCSPPRRRRASWWRLAGYVTGTTPLALR